MSDDKNKMSDKASEIARNIWLAGVGAYGRAVDEAQLRLEKAGVEPPKLFRDLVQAGAALEDEAQQALQAGQQARNSVEERIQRVRENFNLQRPARGEDLRALHLKLDALAAKIDDLQAMLESAQGDAQHSAGTKTKARAKQQAKAKAKTRASTKATTAARTPAKATAKVGITPTSGTKTGARSATTGGKRSNAKTTAKARATVKASSAKA